MYPSSALLGDSKDEAASALPIDELIEKADGFAGVFPGKCGDSSPSVCLVTLPLCERFPRFHIFYLCCLIAFIFQGINFDDS